MKSKQRLVGVSDTEQKLASAVRRLKRENQRLKKEVMQDDLTGLMNARCLRETLDSVLASHKKQNSVSALIFLDVDHFKAINEEHGHVAAGKILTELGRLLSRLVRLDDMAFRYGGDEFVLLVSGGLASAQLVAERIRSSIERHVFKIEGLKGSAPVRLTVSMGLRVISANDSAESILEAADRAMFQAKRNSRNTTVAA